MAPPAALCMPALRAATRAAPHLAATRFFALPPLALVVAQHVCAYCRAARTACCCLCAHLYRHRMARLFYQLRAFSFCAHRRRCLLCAATPRSRVARALVDPAARLPPRASPPRTSPAHVARRAFIFYIFAALRAAAVCRRAHFIWVLFPTPFARCALYSHFGYFCISVPLFILAFCLPRSARARAPCVLARAIAPCAYAYRAIGAFISPRGFCAHTRCSALRYRRTGGLLQTLALRAFRAAAAAAARAHKHAQAETGRKWTDVRTGRTGQVRGVAWRWRGVVHRHLARSCTARARACLLRARARAAFCSCCRARAVCALPRAVPCVPRGAIFAFCVLRWLLLPAAPYKHLTTPHTAYCTFSPHRRLTTACPLPTAALPLLPP